MKFEIENNVITSYKRLSYEAWYAFAEFVDNSTQAYFDNKAELDRLFKTTGEKLTIAITYDKDQDFIIIEDNSIGMSEEGLDRSLKVGMPPDKATERSKYGLGMKTAACWFGNKWSISTKKLGEEKGYEINIDVDAIAKTAGDVDLIPTVFDSNKKQHFTIIKITDLNRKFVGRTITKIKEYLGSIYRFDLESGIDIYWNKSKLTYKRFEDELYTNEAGEKYKKYFEFEINNKPVNGWVGVLGKGFGSRKKAGFSIIQSDRVIQGWPNGYKPSSIFGEQEDGSNDLVNQRVVGELYLDKFSVSHTKDKIVWESDEEEQLDSRLGDVCSEAKELALTLRFRQDNLNENLLKYREEAIAIFFKELRSAELSRFLKDVQPFPEKIIEDSFRKSIIRVQNEVAPKLKVAIGSGNASTITVSVYFNEVSDLDPYVLTEITRIENSIIVAINVLHPFMQEISGTDSLLNFIRHCVYDGVAEWKAIELNEIITPSTIKYLKDGLLRIPYEIKSNQMV